MKTIRSLGELRKVLKKVRARGGKIGFVPTMGALHHGHAALVEQSVKENDFTVVSIYVNPLQFGPKEDFKKYPRPVREDQALLKKTGADILFLPSHLTMYPKGFSTAIDDSNSFSPSELSLTNVLCGKSRPGHFRGVMTVVAKLFNMVKPYQAYFGLKDYQQALVIKKMVKDLNLDIRLRFVPIVRDEDGLAVSSRNRYLDPIERQRALNIYRMMEATKRELLSGQTQVKSLVRKAKKSLASKIDRIDYFDIVDPVTLQSLTQIKPTLLIVAACFVGKTRLIDNMRVVIRSLQRRQG